MRILVSIACAATLGWLVLPACAQARTAKQITAEAKRQYSVQEYERTIKLLEPVVAAPETTPEQKIDAYELIGLSHLILGDAARARKAFEKLLSLDPRHELRDPSGSPKLRSFFEGVREAVAPGPVSTRARIDEKPPEEPIAGRVAEFTVRLLRGHDEVRWVVLYWRAAGETSFRTVPYETGSRDERTARLELPPSRTPYKLEYYVEAKAPSGAPVARVGSIEQPLTISVRGALSAHRQGKRAPIYRRWWFWTLVGAAVAGVAVGVAVGVQREPPEGNLPPRLLRLPLSRF